MSFDLEEEEERSLGLKLDREHARRLLGFVRPHLAGFVATFLVLLVLLALDLVGPWILREVVDGPISSHLAGNDLAPGDWLPWVIAYVAVLVLAFAGHFGQVMLSTAAGQRVVRDLRVGLFSHLLMLSPDYFERTQTGRLVTRISSDCENLSELFTTGVVTTLADLLKIIGLLVACLVVSPSLTLIVLCASPLLIVLALVFQRHARQSYRRVRGFMSRLTGWFAEAMQGVRVTRLFAREEFVAGRYLELNREVRRGWIRALILFGLFFAFVELATGATQAALLWPASNRIPQGTLTYGEFFQFWSYFALMVGPIRELGEKYNVIQSAFASAERIFHILDERSSLPESDHPLAATPGPVGVRFENVHFAYQRGVPVLQAVDFEIAPGGHVAVVGPTGAGKSTLIQLLARFRDPMSGCVRVGGHDLRDLDLRAHRRRIGIVLQDVFLFASDILENIRLWDESISEERVSRALEAVQAQDIVERIGGLRVKVEERGATLSQGEKQLLAFARALVHDPAILVLDEATASIDTPTERKIQQAMQVAMRGRTTLVIAHRLSTVRDADEILVLDRGRLVERGSHHQLLAAGGLYASLAETFAGGESEA